MSKDDPRVLAAIDDLRLAGQRITKARRAVLEAIAASKEHPTADDIHAAVARRAPEVHLATVYRTLETMRELGIIEHTHLRHGPAVFRLAADAHEHLVCEGCGSVVDVPSEALRPVRKRLQQDYGFRVGTLHFAITGRCERCT